MKSINDCKTIPDMFIWVVDNFGKDPNRPALKRKVENEYRGISHLELYKNTENFAYGLAELGIRREDKIAIISENRPEWVYSDLAILGLGAIDVPLYPSLTSDSVEFILNNSESKGIIVSNKFQLNKILKIRDKCKSIKFIIILNDKDYDATVNSLYTFTEVLEMGKKFGDNNPQYFRKQIELCGAEDLCTIIYTSGTTGEPKGVMLTHNNILSNVKSALDIMPISSKDVFLSFLPLCHIFERMGGYYTAFASGGIICYAESIETVAQNLIEVKPTIMTTVPRLFERIYSRILKNVESQPASKQKIFYWAMNTGIEFQRARKDRKLTIALSVKNKLADKLVFKKLKERTGGKLRFFISGGAALPRELGEFFEAIGIIILEGYGLTESSPVITVNRLDDYKFGTVGKPIPNVEVKIASDGEILAKGPNIMKGYFKNKKETDATIKDGWLHTGDIGVFDADGFLMITDRKKHLFKTSAGKYIAPTPIENLFLASRYIDQFVIIGDRRMFITALIVPDFDALKEYADSHNIPYNSVEDLTLNDEVYQMFEKELSRFQKKLANYERVRKFVLLNKAFTIEDGEITPSLKIKRKSIEERYADLIDQMYKSLEKKSES